MRPAGRDLDRQDGSVLPAGHKLERPPISVVVGVTSLVASVVWVAALTPSVDPTLTVTPPQSLASLLFSVALLVGTLLGVRLLWGITLAVSALSWGLVLSEALTKPQAQTIGGCLLLTVAWVCLILPSARDFEQRRVRLVLV